MRSSLLVLVLLAVLAVPVMFAAGDDKQAGEDVTAKLLGTWMMTHASSSIILHVQPEGEALYVFSDKGSHSIGNTQWKPMAGGLLVEGLPRFRFWKTTSNDFVTVEMERLPPEMTSAEWQKKPHSFSMRRVENRSPLPKALLERSFPDGWANATPSSK